MTVSLRLPPELDAKLTLAAGAAGISKSEYLRQCLVKQLEAEPVDRAKLAWELGKDIFGKFRSGRSDLSEKVEEILHEELNAKRRNRRLRSADRPVRRRRPAS